MGILNRVRSLISSISNDFNRKLVKTYPIPIKPEWWNEWRVLSWSHNIKSTIENLIFLYEHM